jgi:CRISPR/Cas system-associated exonuclease Cas4 (RecB family)
LRLSSALAERTKAKNAPGVLVPAIREHMLGKHMEGENRRWDIIHPSELSHQKDFCPRAVWLRIVEGPVEPTKFDYGLQNIFDEGHNIHAKWQDRMRAATPLWGNWKCLMCGQTRPAQTEPERKVPSWVTPGHDVCTWQHLWEYMEVQLNAEKEALIAGHADGAAWTTLAEIKSVGEGTVRMEDPDFYKMYYSDKQVDLKEMWKDITRPFKTHVNQVDIYLWICDVRGYPFTSAEFIYESKWNQLVKNFTIRYSEERSMKLVSQAIAIKDAIKAGDEPKCRFPGTCKNCLPYDERRANKEA